MNVARRIAGETHAVFRQQKIGGPQTEESGRVFQDFFFRR
jgi:hypothetical protein